jgi:hypothetical protein
MNLVAISALTFRKSFWRRSGFMIVLRNAAGVTAMWQLFMRERVVVEKKELGPIIPSKMKNEAFTEVVQLTGHLPSNTEYCANGLKTKDI